MRGDDERPETRAAVLVDGWLHTGDLGQIVRAGA
jgi:long-subunit acyl-CoA synthetase (AMP-forming)